MRPVPAGTHYAANRRHGLERNGHGRRNFCAGEPSTGIAMTKAVSIALIVGGIVLLYFGGQSIHSFSNDMSRMFTGAPTNKTIVLVACGVVTTIAGLIGLGSSAMRKR
jgi:NO-binding membrane sensor protein with MHYT domain